MMKSNMIALVTDFGTADGYVGAMKGQILSEAPEAKILDISHQVEPYNIRQAAFCLNNSYPYFQNRTVFVAVVDPGVGTKRRGLIVKTSQHYFVGPDNGIFSFVFSREGYQAFEIALDKFMEEISPTFHGRDVFARIAAWLACGQEIGGYLKPAQNVVSFLKIPQKVSADKYFVEVIHIDRFGNLIMNMHKDDWEKFGLDNQAAIQIGDMKFQKIYPTFGSVPEDELLLTWDSSGFLQIAQHKGNANRILNYSVGDQLQLIP